MKTKFFLIIAAILIGIAVIPLTVASESQNSDNEPSLVGSYELIMRQLPDGTRKTAPDVTGLLTYTKKHRNLNVIWKDVNGKIFSYSQVSTYRLTDTEYSETVVFSVLNDQISGKQISYDLSGQTRSVSVTMKNDGKIEFKLPFDPAMMVFDENWITAKTEGMFTDYWERVD